MSLPRRNAQWTSPARVILDVDIHVGRFIDDAWVLLGVLSRSLAQCSCLSPRISLHLEVVPGATKGGNLIEMCLVAFMSSGEGPCMFWATRTGLTAEAMTPKGAKGGRATRNEYNVVLGSRKSNLDSMPSELNVLMAQIEGRMRETYTTQR